MNDIERPDVRKKFESYPAHVSSQLLALRQLVLDTAEETDGVGDVEETLKWGEPAYVTRGGSTIRMDYKPKAPRQYALYMNCNTSLIATCRELFGDLLQFEGDRAIVFRDDQELPVDAVRRCIRLALTYHRVKHLPLLGEHA